MKKTGFSLIFVMGLSVMAFALFSCGDKGSESSKAVVTFVTGKATVSYGGSAKKPLKVREELAKGAVIKTSSKSLVTVQINTVGVVRIAENSTLKFDDLYSEKTGTALKLEGGEVFSKIIKNKNRKYKVYTNTLVASVRGTEFLTVAGRKGGKVLVRNGVVAVASDKGKAEEKVTADMNALVSGKGNVKVISQRRVEKLVLEKYSLHPYVKNAEKLSDKELADKFKVVEPREIEIDKKIEKAEVMELSPLDRLREMGKPLVKIYVKDGSQLMGAVEETTEKEIRLNTGESVISIPKSDIRRRIPVK